MKFLLSALLLIASTHALAKIDLEKIKLPPGFKIELFAKDVSSARSLAISPAGTVFVGSRSGNEVHAIRDGQVFTIAKGLDTPNGVAFRDGSLYVAEVSRILRFDDIEKKLASATPGKALDLKPAIVTDKLPTETHHGWKFIAFGPDGWLYVPVGAPCNVCARKEPEFATILRMKPDGSAREVFASGVRNTVGFDWHPVTHELWFTDNGRDMLGDDIPGDELNRAPKKGLNFGFPYCHAGSIPDPEFGKKHACSEFTPPEAVLGPHVASLGMRFYTGKMFPESYRNVVFIAEHGSWNRSTPIGYRVTIVTFEKGKSPRYGVFAEGWLGAGGSAWGRPVDVQVMPDGALLVSDDTADAIYRISYSAPAHAHSK